MNSTNWFGTDVTPRNLSKPSIGLLVASFVKSGLAGANAKSSCHVDRLIEMEYVLAHSREAVARRNTNFSYDGRGREGFNGDDVGPDRRDKAKTELQLDQSMHRVNVGIIGAIVD